MKNIYIIILTIVLCSNIVNAQDIAPTNLFQIYKVHQMDDAQYYKYAYQYLMTIDQHWTLAYPPDKNDGKTFIFGYKIDSSNWFKAHEYELTWINDLKSQVPKAIVYSFTDLALWKSYNLQMDIMNAKHIAEDSYNGGHQVIYKVNDIVIFLRDFPPGINGDDRIYQVQLQHEPTN